jgi:hypothetical protein
MTRSWIGAVVWLVGCGVEGTSAESETPVVASIRGVVQGAVDGEDLLVDVVYRVEPGADGRKVGLDALAEIEPSAIPYDGQRFAFIDIFWETFPTIHYNGSNVDSSVAADDHEGAYRDSLTVWNSVSGSDFAFTLGSSTTRCPSLVKECGQQVFDGFNDSAWVQLRGSASTLAVTWTGTTTDEADQAYNTNNTWSIGDPNTPDIDFFTVAAHENGHSLGLGHSNVNGAIMEAFYSGPQSSLHADDIAGLTAKYPSGGGGGCTSDGQCDDGDACTDDQCDSGTCSNDPIPNCGGECGPPGDSCASDGECCSGRCRGQPGNQTCR